MKKNDIIIAALHEFSTCSYDKASVNNIIKISKTSKGTFYHYFKNKEELYLFLADMLLSDKMDFFKTAESTNKMQNPSNIFDLFRIQIEKSIDFSLAYPDYTTFIIKVRNEPNQMINKKILDKIGEVSSNYYYQIINENINNNIIRNDLPIDFIVKITSYMLTHFLEFMELLDCELTIDNKDHIKKQFDHYISFIENGLSSN